jgi:hypothetical protein
MPASVLQTSVLQTMDAEKIIAEIELLEHIARLPDKRPLRMSDWKAANQKHDEIYANNPWFRLWMRAAEIPRPPDLNK